MRHPFLMLHLLGLRLTDQLRQALDAKAEDPERGSVTIEQVAWAAAVIAIVAIAVAAIRAYVTTPGRTPLTSDDVTRPARLRALPLGSMRSERGSTSVQMVILMPVLFSVMFLGLQAALFYHARTVAIAAAQEGARAAGAETGSASDGIAAATSFVAAAGGSDVLENASVSGSRSATQATVTVRGVALSVIPGWSPIVQQSATVPVERITTG